MKEKVAAHRRLCFAGELHETPGKTDKAAGMKFSMEKVNTLGKVAVAP